MNYGIDSAKAQLLNVDITYDGNLYTNNRIRKHIIMSLYSPQFEIWDIDPPSEKGGKDEKQMIVLDLPEILMDFYKNIYYSLVDNKLYEEYFGIKYMLVNRGTFSIGLNQDVFENMKNIEKYSANNDIYVDKHLNIYLKGFAIRSVNREYFYWSR